MDKKEFLNKYFENKDEWYMASNCIASNDFYCVFIHKVDKIIGTNIPYCRIESTELFISIIADFMIPEKYEDFKTVMDIFLK